MTEIRDDNGDVPAAAEGANLLDKYELGRLLGCGAFAKVYHGRNRRTGQNVAIKVVSKQKVLKGGLTAHIKREIDILSRLRHPHIVRLHEVLATKTKIYFILEFAKGGELFAKVAKGRFTEDLSRRYFQQLISVIGYCHSRGVYHRDLKPENLLLDENWDLKVTDFGLSAVTDQIQPDGLLHTLCGTPAYVAPEILTKKGYDGAKVDIWSCGIILFVLNAGYLPFNDPNLMVMYRKIYKGEFRCPKWTSPGLKRFLTRLLDTNPQNRITVEEMVNDPWFKIGYKEIKFHEEHLDLKDRDDDDDEKHLNAFDIISFSPGVDLSGLFNRPNIPAATKRFVSAESPDKIIDKLEAAAQTEGLTAVKKKRCGAVIEGQNGNFTGVVEIYQLTEKLVVVQVKYGGGISGQTWKDKLWPQLSGLIYQPARQVTGD